MATSLFDLVVRGGTLVTGEGPVEADLGIRAGRIAAWGRGLSGRETLDASGRLVIPGGVDPHVHFEMPTPVTRTADDWSQGSLAALCGGTTTVVDFVEPEDDQPLMDAARARRAQADGRSWTDYSLHMTLPRADARTLSQVQAVVAQGMPTFKLYTTYAGFALNDDELLEALTAVAQAGGLAFVHAEGDPLLRAALRRLQDAGDLSPRRYAESRPALAEVEAVRRVIALARFAGARVYFVHVSTAAAAAALRAARRSGQPVYGETCPQYLLLDESRYAGEPAAAAAFVCAPPLRTPADGAALWRALAEGVLESVGTDHCAFHRVGQKDRHLTSFRPIPGGLPGVEARLGLLYTFGVRAGVLTPAEWVERCCAAPARLCGLAPRKGTLLPGADADLVLFDPERRVTLGPGALHEAVDYTPYDGFELRGWPESVLLRGRQVLRAGQPLGLPTGEFIPGAFARGDA